MVRSFQSRGAMRPFIICGISVGIAIFIDVTILLTCLNFDIDIESFTIYIKSLNY